MGRMRRRDNKVASQATTSSPTPQPSSSSMPEDSPSDSKSKRPKKSAPKAAPPEVLTGTDRYELEQVVTDFIKAQLDEMDVPDLSKARRAHVHRLGQRYGLKTRTHTKDGQRVLSIIRRESGTVQLCQAKSQLQVSVPLVEYVAKSLPQLMRRNGKRAQGGYQIAWPQNGINGYGLVSPALIPPPNRCFSSSIWRERKDLPIAAQRSRIIRELKGSQILIVNGATGSGKSTQLPQYILEDAADRNQQVRIVVSQPRRVAAISVASRIAQERHEQLGQTVGYQIRMDSKCCSNTALAFTTSGCLLRALAMDAEEFFKQTTHLIIDEVHERDLDTDFLLLATKIELKRNRKLKLILMSATMNLVDLSAYFGAVPTLDIEGRSYGVRIFHLEQILEMTGYMTPKMKLQLEAKSYDDETDAIEDNVNFEDKKFDTKELLAAYNNTYPIHNMDIDYDLIVSLLDMLLRIGNHGAVIVYLPGYHDMTVLLQRLERELPRNKIKTHMLHSQMDAGQQKAVFQVYPRIQLKIIVSTNIGQTSITIPDLLYVIDMGKAKIKTYDPSTDTSQLTCSWISKADAQQRAGRVGRRQHGICYRLYSSERLEMMSEYVIPEMQRRTLDEICLLTKVAAPEMPVAEFLSNALNPPANDTVVQSCSRLKLLGILGDENEQITDLGKIISMLPLDVHMGKCLVYSIYYRCLGTMTIIAAFYSVRDPFVLTADSNQKGHQQAFRRCFGADILSDSLGIIKLYEEYSKVTMNGRQESWQYCEKNFVCRQSMDMFLSAVTNLRESVKRIFRFGFSYVSTYDMDYNMIRLALTSGLYPKLAFVDRSKKGMLLGESHTPLQFSRNSCLFLRYNRKNLTNLPSDWIIYVEKSRFWEAYMTTIEQTTIISSLMLALAGGKIYKLEKNHDDKSNEEEKQPDQEDEDEDERNEEKKSSQNDISCVDNYYIHLDNWIKITVEQKFGEQLIQLRSQISKEFNEMLKRREMCQSMNFRGPEVVQNMLQLNFGLSGLFPNLDPLPDQDGS